MTTLDAFLVTPTVHKSQVDYIMQWRELWTDHVYWTRSELWAVHVFSRKLAGTWTNFAIEGVTDKLPGFNQTVGRLLASCREMRDLLRPYFGDDAAERFGEIMTTHLELDAGFVKETSNGMVMEAAAVEKAWHANAEQIAALLATANLNLPEEPLSTLFNAHLKLTKVEAIAIINGDHGAEIAAFDEVLHQAHMMSDSLAHGIIRQFPERFQ